MNPNQQHPSNLRTGLMVPFVIMVLAVAQLIGSVVLTSAAIVAIVAGLVILNAVLMRIGIALFQPSRF